MKAVNSIYYLIITNTITITITTCLIFHEEDPRCPLRFNFKKDVGTLKQNILCCSFSFSFRTGCDLNLTCGAPPPSQSAAYFKLNISPHSSGRDQKYLRHLKRHFTAGGFYIPC